ncbi:MAG: hypothetical protein ACI9E1_000149 [Cryomorphaceae bacterium]|jgi:hypothetical protein
MKRFIITTVFFYSLACPLAVAEEKIVENDGERVSFNDKIRPILNRSCVGCHGGVKKAGGISLIYRAEALGKGESGKTVIVPGKPDESDLYRRIMSDDPKIMMPLVEEGGHSKPLSADEKSLIKTWIEQGAHWEEHWAYIKPELVDKSKGLKDPSWVKQPMDTYILSRLESLDLKPSKEADKAQWLRRASLDIIGLPPSPADLEGFLSNNSPDAYEKAVHRLVNSPRYGERWASLWMDLARYADTMGYEKDPHRDVWQYREWLIKAFNNDMPYDEFLRDQLAGDLLEKPTTDQMIATAFLRNSQTNTEGGTDDEEYRVMALIDRVNTTWSSLQGITFGCTQCHSHPYEPIPHEDYFKFSAFFNNTEDCDLQNEFPKLLIATDPAKRDDTTSIQLEIESLKQQVNRFGSKKIESDTTWESLKFTELKASAGKIAEQGGILITSGTHPVNTHFTLKAKPLTTGSISAIRFSIIPQEKDPAKLPERASVLSQLIVEKIASDGSKSNITLKKVFADSAVGQYEAQESLAAGRSGFGGYPKLFKRREAVFIPAEPISMAEGDLLEIKVYCKASTTGSQASTVRKFQIATSQDPNWTAILTDSNYLAAETTLAAKRAALKPIKGSYIPILKERAKENIRETRMFIGGLWLNKGEKQEMGVPAVINQYKAKTDDRLDMAKWMAHKDNPLTSRVMANRVFAELFGRGIVETLGDLGSSGVKPTNLPLLDYLALSFQDKHQWSVKSMLGEMVLSAAYRQDNRASENLAARDPKNLWLARGPRTRLTAEMVRDNALAVSGLATYALGGRSVMPPQPDGVWQTVYSGAKWKNAVGPDRYRRSVYTYWKRTSPYPSMLTFDAPSRDVCVPQRISTNTPLQALVTLNDPVFLESSQHLAKRMVIEGGGSVAMQISYGYKLATQKVASAATVKTLTDLYHQLSIDYKSEDHSKLAPTPEEAAMVIIGNALLNIDAAITK